MEMGVVSESGPCTVKVGRCRTVKVLCYSMFQHIHRTMSPMSPRNASFAQKVRENLEDCQAEAQPANITTCDLEAN